MSYRMAFQSINSRIITSMSQTEWSKQRAEFVMTVDAKFSERVQTHAHF